MELWERQPGEPPKAFEAFKLYRDMGYNRSLNKVRIELNHKSRSRIADWSTRYMWQERLAAYQRELDRIEMIAHKEAVKKAAERQAKAGQEMQALMKFPAKAFMKRIQKRNPETGQMELDMSEFDSLEIDVLFELILRSATATKTAVDIERTALNLPIAKSENDIEIRQAPKVIGKRTAEDEAITDHVQQILARVGSSEDVEPGADGA